jgi:hypothetical protein
LTHISFNNCSIKEPKEDENKIEEESEIATASTDICKKEASKQLATVNTQTDDEKECKFILIQNG